MATRRADCVCILCIVMHASAWFALPTYAADDGWGGSIAVTTDYVYRGISQTGGRGAAQGGLRFQSPTGWSAGIWGSSVDFGSGSTYEVDLHAAYGWSIGTDWSAQLGLVHYDYPTDRWADYDYDELTASLSFQQRMTASVAWSPNASRYGYGTFVSDASTVAYELAVLQPLGGHWSISGGLGYYDLHDLFGEGYWFWNTGLTFTWDALQIDLLHIDTDPTAQRLFQYRGTGGRWTAALSWRF